LIFLQDNSEKGLKFEVREPDSYTISNPLITFDPTDSQGTKARY
jgi:hypothetical protein